MLTLGTPLLIRLLNASLQPWLLQWNYRTLPAQLIWITIISIKSWYKPDNNNPDHKHWGQVRIIRLLSSDNLIHHQIQQKKVTFCWLLKMMRWFNILAPTINRYCNGFLLFREKKTSSKCKQETMCNILLLWNLLTLRWRAHPRFSCWGYWKEEEKKKWKRKKRGEETFTIATDNRTHSLPNHLLDREAWQRTANILSRHPGVTNISALQTKKRGGIGKKTARNKNLELHKYITYRPITQFTTQKNHYKKLL